MRRALVLLIASTTALADRLQEVVSVRLDAAPLGMVSLEVNGSALTVVLLKVGEAGKLVLFDAGGKIVAAAVPQQQFQSLGESLLGVPSLLVIGASAGAYTDGNPARNLPFQRHRSFRFAGPW